jgi:predicted NUDIX family NTP pyrophosphohydrolase
VVYSAPLGLRARVLGESTGQLQLDGSITYPVWIQYDTGRAAVAVPSGTRADDDDSEAEEEEEEEHACVVRGPMEPVVQYVHETVAERARREVR